MLAVQRVAVRRIAIANVARSFARSMPRNRLALHRLALTVSRWLLAPSIALNLTQRFRIDEHAFERNCPLFPPGSSNRRLHGSPAGNLLRNLDDERAEVTFFYPCLVQVLRAAALVTVKDEIAFGITRDVAELVGPSVNLRPHFPYIR